MCGGDQMRDSIVRPDLVTWGGGERELVCIVYAGSKMVAVYVVILASV